MDSDNKNTGTKSYRLAILAVASLIIGGGYNVHAEEVKPSDPSAKGANEPKLETPNPKLKLAKPKNEGVLKNDIGISGDFMLGDGTVTLPIGYAINKKFPVDGFSPLSISADRSTMYYGGTISYSYGRNLFFDFSYEKGNSSGSQPVQIPNTVLGLGPGSFPANFNIDDAFYQLYLRYNLVDKGKLRFYLRGGISFVEAELTAEDLQHLYYKQTDTTSDILGNLGFGLRYSLYSKARFKTFLNVEGEGFYGIRTQESEELLLSNFGQGPAQESIDNNLYGGLGRATLRGELLLGKQGRWKLSADIGYQFKYTMIDYSGSGASDEMLYGPYVKIGLNYIF